MENNLEILLSGQQFKRLYERTYNQISKTYGLTKIEIEILLFLQNNHSYDTAKDIVELKCFTKSHVSKAIDSLIKRGYVVRKSDVHDRRSAHLKIAPDAQRILEEAIILRDSLKNILYKEISTEEKQIMEIITKKIAKNIREALETEE
jgi:MarR family transcriptional regulator, 2-MHQ and catechol-resistance regulon repressor